MALGFAIVLGLATATGSLIPLFQLHTNQSGAFAWHGAVLGIAIILVGISLCSYAGGIKDRATPASGAKSSTGILLCVAAGLGGSMINIGMVAGAPLAARAAALGVPPLHQTNAVWLPLLFAGFLSTAVYCAWLLTRNGTWRRFIAPGAFAYWLLAVVMAVCWFGSVELYGIAASQLGEWGPVLGWPIFLSSSILTANAWGVATGEWRQASLRPKGFMLAGVCCLVTAIFVIGLTRMGRASS
jgi:L-rhamnose-H+ transport protein